MAFAKVRANKTPTFLIPSESYVQKRSKTNSMNDSEELCQPSPLVTKKQMGRGRGLKA